MVPKNHCANSACTTGVQNKSVRRSDVPKKPLKVHLEYGDVCGFFIFGPKSLLRPTIGDFLVQNGLNFFTILNIASTHVFL